MSYIINRMDRPRITVPGYEVTDLLDKDVYVVERLRDGKCIDVTKLDLMNGRENTLDEVMYAIVQQRFAALP